MVVTNVTHVILTYAYWFYMIYVRECVSLTVVYCYGQVVIHLIIITENTMFA